jgi:hypothetical protein
MIKDKPKKSKNDNLIVYKNKLQKKNEQLVIRAIEHIKSLNGDINFSLVSQVTYDIANSMNDEKGISLAGLSKSKIYRPLIENAQLSHNGKIGAKSSLSNADLSVGDIKLQIHGFRVQLLNLKQENKILSNQLQALDSPTQKSASIDENMLKKYKYFADVCSNLIRRLLELEIAYIDLDKVTLNVQMFDDVILTREALEMLYKDGLNELRN